MKNLLWKLLLLLSVMTAGCGKNEMTLTFSLSSEVNTPCKIVYYASARNVGVMRETVAQIDAGKGVTRLPMAYPSILYLFSPSAQTPSAIIYAQKGDKITITGKNSDIADWEISGNPVTEILTRWRLENKKVVGGMEPVKLNEAVAKFVKANTDSEAAAIILYVYFCRRGHEEEFRRLESSLSKKILDNKRLMNALLAADLLGTTPDNIPFPTVIVARDSSGYADTLPLRDGKPSLLLFRGANSEGNFSPDSLKSLLKRNKERQVAEIFAEPDSMTWSRHLTADTLPGLRQLWLPAGLADSLTISMSVRYLPFIIVTDGKGKPVYRGDNLKEATSIFESQQ